MSTRTRRNPPLPKVPLSSIDFIDVVPDFMSGPRGDDRVPGGRQVATNGRSTLITETGDRYVAPDSARAHGTHVKYVIERCRCLPCTAASREYNKMQRTTTEPLLVDAEPAREHVRAMMALGYGYQLQSQTTGLAEQVYQNLLYGGWRGRDAAGNRTKRPPAKRMKPASVAAILSFRPDQVVVELDDLADRSFVPSRDTIQRWRELVARGYWPGWAARTAGIDRQNIDRLLTKRPPMVCARTARAIRDLHAEWLDREPPKKSRWLT